MAEEKTLVETATDKLHSAVGTAVDTGKQIPGLSVVLFNEIMRTRVPTFGASVAFFFMFSLVPLLMVASAVLAAIHTPSLFEQLLDVMSLLAPPDAMSFVRTMLKSLLTKHAGGIISFGIVSYLYSATGAFSALIDALNIAYDVKLERTWVRAKLQALLLTFTCGAIAIFTLLCLLAGPHLIHFLSYVFPIPRVFAIIWPPIRWVAMFVSFVLNVMLLYYLAPNRKIAFRSEWPGATFAVIIWGIGSLGLDFYIGHFSNYSSTYGSLGAIIVLMLWFYLTAMCIMVGAELNQELWKRRHPDGKPTPQEKSWWRSAKRFPAQP